MATNFPSSLDDSTTIPVESANTKLSTNHVTAHQNIQDAIEAIETKVGADSSAVTTSHDYKLSTITGSNKAVSNNGGTLTSPIINLGSDAEGDTYYRNSSGALTRLARGTDNYIYKMNGNVPNWEAETTNANASTTVAGIVELATSAQVTAGTATGETGAALVVTPDAFNATNLGLRAVFFGDGIDGAVTFDGSTTILGLVPSGNVYTLAKDIYCTNITVNNGVTLKTANYRIFATGTVTITGTISNNGNAGSAGSAGADTSSGAYPSGGGTAGAGGTTIAVGTLPAILAGVSGGAGGTGGNAIAGTAGTAGTAVTYANLSNAASNGGAGGSNGNEGGYDAAGGAAGTGSTPSSQVRVRVPYLDFDRFNTPIYTAGVAGSGGGGGGGGSSTSTNRAHGGGGGGGGSGTHGGILFLAAKSVIVTGTISANGGSGGAGGRGGNATVQATQYGGGGGGGGGGGDGGFVFLTCRDYSNSGSVTASAGTGGTGGSAGSGSTASGDAGSTGANGTAGTVLVLQI